MPHKQAKKIGTLALAVLVAAMGLTAVAPATEATSLADNCAEERTLSFGSTGSGTISPTNTHDIWKIPVPDLQEPHNVVLNVSEAEGADLAWELYKLDANNDCVLVQQGSVVDRFEIENRDDDTEFFPHVYLPTGGTAGDYDIVMRDIS